MSSPAFRNRSASLPRASSPGGRGGTLSLPLGRKTSRFAPSPLGLAVALLLAFTITACASATPQKRAFQVLSGLNDTVEAGMRSAGTLYANGVIGEQQKSKILSLYASYSHAAQGAALALKAANGGDPVTILRSVQDAVNELLSFIESVSRKPVSQNAAPTSPQPLLLIGGGTL